MSCGATVATRAGVRSAGWARSDSRTTQSVATRAGVRSAGEPPADHAAGCRVATRAGVRSAGLSEGVCRIRAVSQPAQACGVRGMNAGRITSPYER